MTLRAPLPGSPYHRLARTPEHRWWRPLVELLLFVVIWMVFAAILNALFEAIAPDKDAIHDGAWGLAMMGGMLASPILVARFSARITGRSGGMVSSVIGRLRWRWLAWCVGIFVLTSVVATGVAVLVELIAPSPEVPGAPAEVWPGMATFLPQLALILLVVPLQAAGEEYALRGTLLQSIGAWARPAWVSIAITGVTFAAMHAPEEAVVWIALLTTGLFAAWLTIRTGGLEAAIALHAVSNVIGFSFGAATGGFGRWASDLNMNIPVVPALIAELGGVLGALLVARRARRIGIATVVSA